jgi:hypothetical protein
MAGQTVRLLTSLTWRPNYKPRIALSKALDQLEEAEKATDTDQKCAAIENT